jgi:hypothetical protein
MLMHIFKNEGKENLLIIEKFSQVRPPLAKPDQTGVPKQIENKNFTVFPLNNLKMLIKPM